jgi:O-antigen/teichoic acid export membrane protein
MKYIAIDETQKNSDRLRRERSLEKSKKLDKHEHLQGIAIASLVGLSIAIILFCAFFPALIYVIDNVPPGISMIVILACIVSVVIFYRGKIDRKKASKNY